MRASNTLQSVRVRDIDVAFRFDGPVDAPVVLLVHGLMTSHGMWDGLVRQLQSEWRVLRYDLRGHGDTTATTGPYSMVQLAEDLIGLLDHLEIPYVHFIGSSLGGMIGQQVGARFPSRLASLTLANTSAQQGAAAAWQLRIDTAKEEGLTPLIQGTLQRWFTASALSSEPQLLDEMVKFALKTSVEGFTGCAAAVRDLSQSDILSAIRVPTLVMAGEFDQATPLRDSELLVNGISGATLVVLPAAHQSAVQLPQIFAEIWLDFQRRIAGDEHE